MNAVMSRIRVAIDLADEAYKRAFHAHASLNGLSPQELFEKMVEAHCPAELEQARKALAAEADADRGRKKR